MYPERGENNLDGWDEVVETDENGQDVTRNPEN
jgi:hypothetical protein